MTNIYHTFLELQRVCRQDIDYRLSTAESGVGIALFFQALNGEVFYGGFGNFRHAVIQTVGRAGAAPIGSPWRA